MDVRAGTLSWSQLQMEVGVKFGGSSRCCISSSPGESRDVPLDSLEAPADDVTVGLLMNQSKRLAVSR